MSSLLPIVAEGRHSAGRRRARIAAFAMVPNQVKQHQSAGNAAFTIPIRHALSSTEPGCKLVKHLHCHFPALPRMRDALRAERLSGAPS